MSFSQEMVPYCGGTYRVRSVVGRLIDEKTGKMLTMKNPCVILEGVFCQARYNERMINCPRATYSYWREIWLERVSASASGVVDAGASGVSLSTAAAPVGVARESAVQRDARFIPLHCTDSGRC